MSVIVGQPQRMMIYWLVYWSSGDLFTLRVCLEYGMVLRICFQWVDGWKNGFAGKQGFIDGQGAVS